MPRPLVGSVMDSNGIEQFGITETTTASTDGSFTCDVERGVRASGGAPATGVGDSVGELESDGRNRRAGRSRAGRCCITRECDRMGAGRRAALSFTVPAKIPATTNTNAVTLSGLSFSPGTAGFDVYRGSNPAELLRIAASVAVASSYHRYGRGDELIGSAGCELRSREFLLAAWSCSRRSWRGFNRRRRSATRRWECWPTISGRGGADHARNGRGAGASGGREHGDDADHDSGVDDDAGYRRAISWSRMGPGISED